MLDLESAIKHCEEVAEKYDTELNLINCGISNESCDNCLECAEEHRQLADWLRKLKAYEEARKEINGLATVWKEAEGINKCRRILFKHLEEVNANEDKHIRN